MSTNHKPNGSGFIGVWRAKAKFVAGFNEWRSRPFESMLEAAIAHDLYALECVGPGARTNYPAAAYGLGKWA